MQCGKCKSSFRRLFDLFRRIETYHVKCPAHAVSRFPLAVIMEYEDSLGTVHANPSNIAEIYPESSLWDLLGEGIAIVVELRANSSVPCTVIVQSVNQITSNVLHNAKSNFCNIICF